MSHVKKHENGLHYGEQHRSHSGPEGRAGEAKEKVKDSRNISEEGEVTARETILIMKTSICSISFFLFKRKLRASPEP